MLRVLAAVGLSVVSMLVCAQPRVGLLWIKEEGNTANLTAFREGMRARGYVDGKNVRIDERFLVSEYDGIPVAVDRLVAEKPDVIVVWGATVTRAAHKATSTIPIVMVSAGDPVKLGVVVSLAKPGGNVTGTTSLSQDLSGKRLELLRELLPGMKRVAVVLYPRSPGEVVALKNYETAARALNLQLQPVEVHKSAELVAVIGGIPKLNVQAIVFIGSTLFSANRSQIVATVADSRLPAVYSNSDYVRAGGLLSYGTNVPDAFRYVAIYVDKILKGAKPGDLPIEQPTKFELAVNLKTAKALGITIPKSLVERADRVIE